ncbi:MAG TPA: hypothetical protein DIT64_19350 [Verrucomicrobiales bacterium]|nr:hypothetical protein [Verrucomicrobiales bacterium]
MRVSLLHYTLPPAIGGVERVVGTQAEALRSLGHEVSLWPAQQKAEFAAALARGAVDAVIVHNVFTMPFDLEWTRELTRLALARKDVLWINWVHDVAAVNPHYAGIPWKEPAPRALHVAVSEARRRDYERAAGLRDIRVIPNGLDMAQVLGLTRRVKELGLESRGLVLFHPARLVRRKNIELGIRVTSALRKAGVDALYLVSGAPDPHQADGRAYHAELCRLAGELGLDDGVRFLGEDGPLCEADVRALYAAADLLFFPSTGEGFGLPLLEAAAHRLPVWCSDLPAHREVLGDGAHFFPANSPPETISAQIMRWWRADVPDACRKSLWRRHDMLKICLEHLEPLLLAHTHDHD